MKKLPVLFLCLAFLYIYVNCEDSGEFEDEEEDVSEVESKQQEPDSPPREKPVYSPPVLSTPVYFADHFESPELFEKKWILSRSKKDDAESTISKYDGLWAVEEPKTSALKGDLALILKSKAKHHAVSSALKRPFEFNDDPLVVQYEVKFEEGQECGGAYIKLLSKCNDNVDLSKFNDKSPYTIMFGPDKCGNDHKLHFIFRHKNPLTGVYEEKHAKKPSANIDTYFSDKKTHLYTLVVKPDNSYAIYVDQYEVSRGSLLEDFTPPVNPSKEIVDPDDKKPDDWDDRERIRDPDAVKPEDWDETEPEMIDDVDATKPAGWLDDEPELIPDPAAEKPSDWDEDMDGEWEAPLINNPRCASAPGCGAWKVPQIKNPKYKGKWEVPMIDNPNYKGKWSPRTIPNPDYFEDNQPFRMSPIGAIGLELWSMSNDIVFDNFIITTSKQTADEYAKQTWSIKHSEEASDSAGGFMQSVVDATHERPWLWAVIVVVVVLPIVLIVAYCCLSSKGEDRKAGERKKMDARTADDEVDDDENEEYGEEAEGPKEGGDSEYVGNYDSAEKKVTKRTKSDLESKPDQD
ncbi:hypothetical protein HELRODRAFT_184962 [Helobdella robusta]|uniref:Calnexin n=1 Tax=Helobdella robusta TaxID=6412 RepID=T1FM75_HELRO|nr:hypothetical protein HELRODRAFT_184962 [Helobdella robusta]ESO01982.1 hypothetical protein HELRODRAFT_184962 [Helobdella robusta]